MTQTDIDAAMHCGTEPPRGENAPRFRPLTDDEFFDNPQDAFAIEDDQMADWAVRKIMAARREREEMVGHLRYQIELVNRRCAADEQYYTALLESYFDKIPHKKSPTQESYQLKNAKLVRKKPREKLEVDEDALVQWMQENQQAKYIRIKGVPLWTDFRQTLIIHEGCAVIEETGEIVGGVNVVTKPAEFKLEAVSDG